jgi:uncharacterized protein YjiS (DUF1127 family)
MSDRQLRDIGIVRSQTAFAVEGESPRRSIVGHGF